MTPQRTLLFADDSPIIRDLGSLFLSPMGRVVVAESGRQALEMVRFEPPDLVLADYHMPDLGGAELCRSVRSDSSLRHVRVVVMLRGGDPEERAEALRAGADEVLPKPLVRNAVTEAAERFLRPGQLRGLPRIEVTLPVSVQDGQHERQGTLRNLSRDGAFLEADYSLAPESEVGLRFAIPEIDLDLHPTAKVVWRRVGAEKKAEYGLGMRFLAIDGASLRALGDYVFERSPVRANSL